MIDFDKLRAKMREPATHVTYRCEQCGDELEFVWPLPDHMQIHYGFGGQPPCGRLVEVSRREVPRG